MSEALRVALVCEGPTDRIVINAAVSSLLGRRDFQLSQLQPEESLAFGPTGTGWSGVYRWCRQAANQGRGSLRNNPLFDSFDLLVLHLDADVADQTYGSANITVPVEDLPCQRPCPPPADTTNLLRQVVLGWLSEDSIPPKTVLCIPSKSTEAWILAALHPADLIVRSGTLECRDAPANLLSAKPAKSRLVRAGKKIVERYQDRAVDIRRQWSRVRALSEAERFSTDFLAVIAIAA
jgi:hypothetical protein